MISRDDILSRSKLYVGQIPYSQDKLWSDGYRCDCSGYVSRCWHIPPSENGSWGGYSTQTFATKGIMYPLASFSELQPGDAVGRCGPGTAGNGGHIMLWLGKNADGTHHIRDHGSGSGPKERNVTLPSDYQAFRFLGVEGAVLPPFGYRMLKQGMYGYYDVKQLQGYLKLTADGEFGPATYGAVRAFQTAYGLEVDGIVGPETVKALLLANAPTTPPPVVTPPPTVPDVPWDRLIEMVSALQSAQLTQEQIKASVKMALMEGVR